MDDISRWTATQTNRYLYKQLKALLETHGFVVSTARPKLLVRLREHHLQAVSPKITYGVTSFLTEAAPAASYSDYIYSHKTVLLKRSSDPKLARHFFDELADQTELERTGKRLYLPEEVQQVWASVTAPQIKAEIIDYLNAFDFSAFAELSRGCPLPGGQLHYCGCPGNHDALRFLAMGCHAIWLGEYDAALPLLTKAAFGYESFHKMRFSFALETDAGMLQNLAAAKEIIKILENKCGAWETALLDRLTLWEKDAAEKTWGVYLDASGQTKKRKKQ